MSYIKNINRFYDTSYLDANLKFVEDINLAVRFNTTEIGDSILIRYDTKSLIIKDDSVALVNGSAPTPFKVSKIDDNYTFIYEKKQLQFYCGIDVKQPILSLEEYNSDIDELFNFSFEPIGNQITLTANSNRSIFLVILLMIILILCTLITKY